MKLLNIDRNMFDSISIDPIFIYMGKKKVRRDDDLSIYQQLYGYFKLNKLNVQFTLWLHLKYDIPVEEELPDNVIKDWERELNLKTKTLVFTRVFRIMYKHNNNIEFYGLKGEGNSLEYITETKSSSCYRFLVQYLQYNLYCDEVYKELNAEHALEKTSHVLMSEIKLCLRYKLIPIIKDIKVLSNNKKDYCLAYYNLKCGNKTAATPAWDSFISSISDDGSRECFRAAIYSIFKDDNFGRQVIFLHGRGRTGKTRISESLVKRLNKINPLITTNIVDRFLTDKFTSSVYVNKRLIKAPDTKDRALLRTQDVKNITGKDTKNVRRMGQLETSENVYAKIIATSNFIPWVDPEKEEEISRCLFISIDSKLAYEANRAWESIKHGDWERQLDAEIDNFIAKCEEDYYKCLMPDGHNITPYPTMVEELQKGDYYLRRDIKIWWGKCVKPYKSTGYKRTNILTLGDLLKDYNRFVAPSNVSGKNNSLIRSFIITHLRSLEISIYDMEIGNNQYIEGYEFSKNRITLESLLLDVKYEIECEEKEHSEIYQ